MKRPIFWKCFLFFGFVLFFFNILSAQEFSDKKSNDRFIKANSLLKEGKFSAAAPVLDKILKLHPQHLPTVILWYKVQATLNNSKAILEHPLTGEDLEGENFGVWAICKLHSMLLEDKLALLTSFTDHYKDKILTNPKLTHEVGVILYELSEIERAIPHLKLSVQYAPNSIKNLKLLAVAYYRLSQYNQALNVANQILEIDSTSQRGNEILAYSSYYTHDYPTAVNRFNWLIEERKVSPNVQFCRFYQYLGMSQSQMHEYDNATENLVKALRVTKDSLWIYEYLVYNALRIPDLDTAEKYLIMIEKIAPESMAAYLNRVSLEIASQNWEGAEVALEKAYELDSTSRRIAFRRADIFLKRDRDFDKALEYYKSFEYPDEKSKNFISHIGYLSSESSNFSQAISYLNRAIESSPFEPYFYSNRGNVRRQLKDYEGARKDFEKSTEMDPKNSYVFFNMARLNYDLGEWEQFCENMKKARELGFEETYFYMDHIKFPDAECP